MIRRHPEIISTNIPLQRNPGACHRGCPDAVQPLTTERPRLRGWRRVDSPRVYHPSEGKVCYLV